MFVEISSSVRSVILSPDKLRQQPVYANLKIIFYSMNEIVSHLIFSLKKPVKTASNISMLSNWLYLSTYKAIFCYFSYTIWIKSFSYLC